MARLEPAPQIRADQQKAVSKVKESVWGQNPAIEETLSGAEPREAEPQLC